MKTICPYCGADNHVLRKSCKHCHKSLKSKGEVPSRNDDDIPAIIDSDNIDYDDGGEDVDEDY